MSQPKICALLLPFLCAALPPIAAAQSQPYGSGNQRQLYSDLLREIQKIPIFDDHSHPGFPDDPDVDAMASPPGTLPLRIRADNPELIAASKALFGYPYDDFSHEHSRWLVDRKKQLKRDQGAKYFDPRHSWHDQVEHNRIGWRIFDYLQSVVAIFDSKRPITA